MRIRILALLPAGHARRLHRLVPESLAFLSVEAPQRMGRALTTASCDLVVLDRARLGTDPRTGLAKARAAPGSPEVLVLSHDEDAVDRAALLAGGCMAVLHWGLDDDSLADALLAMIQRRRQQLQQQLQVERTGRPGSLQDFVSRSPGMQRFLAVVRRVIETDTSLLIQGETGVGKERLARALHDEGPRRAGPFVAVNCGALPENLLESELFGHQAGAFTGAVQSRRGLFETADGGTLFLDEVGEMPLNLQVKLLRVLQDRRIRPLGAEQDLAVDVRVLAATNRDLQAEMRAGRFRTDLYYRLGVVTLTVPPLRDRREDIPAIVEANLEDLCRRYNRRSLRVSDQALAALQEYGWPGNVRELVNVLERAVLLCEGVELTPAELPDDLAGRGSAPTSGDPLWEKPWTEALAQVCSSFERDYWTRLLQRTGGRVGEAARLAGISPRALYGKMRRLGLRKEDFRPPRAVSSP